MAKLPTLEEVSRPDSDDLNSARTRLAKALKSSRGQPFTYSADLFPDGTAATLLGELTAAGWKYKFVNDPRDGDYYNISRG